MYELMQVGERTYYIDCPAKIGVFLQEENQVFLIDSGNDKDAGRRVRKILDEKGWILKGIINTHSNADHIGGNYYLQQNTGCSIFTDGIERAFTQYPILEPSFLYGGFPPKDLRNKFLLAKESDVAPVSHKDFPKELEVISLPGHFFDMFGVRTPDNIIFLADCINSKEILEKYRIPFIYDIKTYLETLDNIKTLDAAKFIPSHTQVLDTIVELADFNTRWVYQTGDEIVEICAEGIQMEEILKTFFDRYELKMDFNQYVLVGSTIRSYLSWLRDQGRITVEFFENRLLWKKI